jgi:hypothetical protein
VLNIGATALSARAAMQGEKILLGRDLRGQAEKVWIPLPPPGSRAVSTAAPSGLVPYARHAARHRPAQIAEIAALIHGMGIGDADPDR